MSRPIHFRPDLEQVEQPAKALCKVREKVDLEKAQCIRVHPSRPSGRRPGGEGIVRTLCALAVLALWPLAVTAEFDPDMYRRFLAENADLTAAELMEEYGGDVFSNSAPADFEGAEFADSIDHLPHTLPPSSGLGKICVPEDSEAVL